MINPETNKSKGYAFIELTNYNEFQSALNNSEPIILGKQKLIFCLAKNRYDYSQYMTNIILNNKENFINYNNIKIYELNNNHRNEKNNIKISRKSEGNIDNTSNYFTNNSLFFEGTKEINQNENKDNNILKIEKINNYPIQEQIKYSLKKLASLYENKNHLFLQSKPCMYYCGPFLNIDSNEDSF